MKILATLALAALVAVGCGDGLSEDEANDIIIMKMGWNEALDSEEQKLACLQYSIDPGSAIAEFQTGSDFMFSRNSVVKFMDDVC